MKKGVILVILVIPGRGAVEAESAEGAFQLLPMLQASTAPRIDGHLVAEALRRKDDVEITTRCGKKIYFLVPLRPEDRSRADAPLSCAACRR